MYRKQLLSLMVVLISAIPAVATELWGGATVGMAESDIQGLFPEAGKPDSGRPFLPGTTQLLSLPEVEYAEHQFEAEFYFGTSGLVQVALVNRKIEKARQINKACNALNSTLTENYGDATTERVTKSSSGKHQYSIYEQDRLFVRLSCEAPFTALRIVFQSRDFVEKFAPFGLPQDTSIDEIIELMSEPPSMGDETLSGADDAAADIALEAQLANVPRRPPGEGKLRFKVRASKRNGLCFVQATLEIPEEENFGHLFKAASLSPSNDIFGVPTNVGGASAGFEFSFFPTQTSPFSSDTWSATANEALPGSLDQVVHISGNREVDGIINYVQIVQYLYANQGTCGLSRDDMLEIN
jgi:hypothetical protein